MLQALQFLFFILTAYAAADFITGFFHWLEDTYGKESWGEWLFRNIVEPNIEHHANPRQFTYSPYWERVKLSCYLAAPIVVTGLLCRNYWFVWFALFASQANQIHCWAHRGRGNNPVIQALQLCRIVQQSSHHGEHHRSPYRSRYCVMTPWLNPILDGVRFWRVIEWALAVYAIQPRDFKVTV